MVRRILRLRDVMDRTGLSKPTIYRGMRAGTFPNHILISKRAIGWPEEFIDDWISGRESKEKPAVDYSSLAQEGIKYCEQHKYRRGVYSELAAAWNAKGTPTQTGRQWTRDTVRRFVLAGE